MEPAAPAKAEIDARLWRHFPPILQPIDIHPLIPTGLSGSVVWKVRTHAGDVAVRKFGPRTSNRTTEESHSTMSLARRFGWKEVPQPFPNNLGLTTTQSGDDHWDLCTWQPGEPAKLPIDGPHLRSALHFIARWHSFWTKERAGWNDNVILQTAEQRRRAEWRRLYRNGIPDVLHFEHAADPLGLNSRAWRAASARARRLEEILGGLPPLLVGEPLVFCHGDLHHEHLLFAEGVPTGLIDLSCRWDYAAADLARWLPSVADANRWPQAIEWYREKALLSERSERAIPMLVETGLAIAALRWREWLLGADSHRRCFPRPDLAYGRWREVVERLERLEL